MNGHQEFVVYGGGHAWSCVCYVCEADAATESRRESPLNLLVRGKPVYGIDDDTRVTVSRPVARLERREWVIA